VRVQDAISEIATRPRWV